MTYETSLVKHKKAATAYEKAAAKLREANEELEASKREIKLGCSSCGHETKVSDIELIVKKFDGWQSFDNYDPDWHYSTRIMWVCPKCTAVLEPPEDKGPFIRGFDKYVKVVHEWYSDSQRCHGRVLELLAPYFKREEEREAKADHERKVREARKLLAKEDSPGNTTA
jgi:hypothetical protein